MTINKPSPSQIPQLRRLWQQAFGDTDAFLDSFFSLGFSPERCRCLCIEDQVAAALYWFDASFEGRPIAYLYAVATAADFRNQGLCRALMEDTHRHLKGLGYDEAMLVPGSEALFRFYEKLGYRTATYIRTFTCRAGDDPISLRRVDAEEYAALRRRLLPSGSVLQEGPILTFLASQAAFYAAENVLLVAASDGDLLLVPEFLGPPEAAPGILAALGADCGHFRTPGTDIPFSMIFPLSETESPTPAYFALALD